jgi:hypothetical protein
MPPLVHHRATNEFVFGPVRLCSCCIGVTVGWCRCIRVCAFAYCEVGAAAGFEATLRKRRE